MVKLDAMENPYRLPDRLRAELGAACADAELNRYPDPEARALKAVLRDALLVPDGMDMLLGNGSDEIIQLLAMGCARPGAAMLGVEPSFVMFSMIARCCGMRFVGVPLTRSFALDTEAVVAAMDREKPSLTFIAFPNNPTGNLFDRHAIETIIRSASGLVVIDEAYHPFAQASFMPRLGEFPNLLVMRTLSKLGLAGLRLGALAGPREWIAEFNKLRLPYNVNALTQSVAARVLKDPDVLVQQAERIRDERHRMLAALGKLEGVRPYPSDANFIMFSVPRAEAVFQRLLNRRVLIKKLTGSHPALDDCLRVTVGTAAENDEFLGSLAASLRE
jgi:histidinol-phosphate aminotransferase